MSETYATLKTNRGDIVIHLFPNHAPKTVQNFVGLAEGTQDYQVPETGKKSPERFYDGLGFHRIAPGFVIQGGDPTQSGAGGPGYSTVDRPQSDAAYVKGVVAMAKTQAEPAGTAGSQFFVVTGDDIGLPPDYAIVGKVTKGLDVVQLIGTQGDPATEQPLRPVVVRSVTAASTP